MNSNQYFSNSYWFQVEERVDEETAHELALWNLDVEPEQPLNFDEDNTWD